MRSLHSDPHTEPIQWVNTALYVGVTNNTQLTRSNHINQVRKKAAHIISQSFSNSASLCKKLVPPHTDYACNMQRSATCIHVRKLQVVQTKCLNITTNPPWHIINKHIHEDLESPTHHHIGVLRVLTPSQLVRGITQFDNLEDTCVDQGPNSVAQQQLNMAGNQQASLGCS